VIARRCEEHAAKINAFNEARMRNYKVAPGEEVAPDGVGTPPRFAPSSSLTGGLSAIRNAMVSASERGGDSIVAGADELVSVMSPLLRLAVHPSVCPSTASVVSHWKHKALPQLVQMFDKPVGELPQDGRDSVVKALSSEWMGLLCGGVPQASQGALNMLLVLASPPASPSQGPTEILLHELYHSMLSLVEGAVQSPLLFSLTPQEFLLLTDFEKAVSLGLDSSPPSEVGVKITNADRKKDTARSSRKGGFGRDEDEEWLDRIKRDKEAKANQTKSSSDAGAVERVRQELADKVRH
jgi:hypothetical protein